MRVCVCVCACVHACACVCGVFLPLMHYQDVSSFGNAPIKMCRLSVEGLVCVCVWCVSALNALLRCVVFWQCIY